MSIHSMDSELSQHSSKPSMTESLAENPEPPTQRREFQDGDITLISSDNWAFKIHAFYLQASSPVFRDMLSDPAQDRTIRLVDPETECADTLDKVFWVLFGKLVEHIDREYIDIRWADAWDFFRKYEMHTTQHHLEMSLLNRVSNVSNQPEVFQIAARMNNIAIAQLVIRPQLGSSDEPQFNDVHEDLPKNLLGWTSSDDGDDMYAEPAACSLEWWRTTPIEWIWMLDRARKVCKHPSSQAEYLFTLWLKLRGMRFNAEVSRSADMQRLTCKDESAKAAQ